MNFIMKEAYIDYSLLKEIDKAYTAKVFEDKGIDGEYEDRHVSELKRRVSVFDDKETFIAIRTLYKTHKETFMRTLAYINKEGEKDATDKHI